MYGNIVSHTFKSRDKSVWRTLEPLASRALLREAPRSLSASKISMLLFRTAYTIGCSPLSFPWFRSTPRLARKKRSSRAWVRPSLEENVCFAITWITFSPSFRGLEISISLRDKSSFRSQLKKSGTLCTCAPLAFFKFILAAFKAVAVSSLSERAPSFSHSFITSRIKSVQPVSSMPSITLTSTFSQRMRNADTDLKFFCRLNINGVVFHMFAAFKSIFASARSFTHSTQPKAAA
mmetsp:Transcript_11451/g.20250  ORF Transcript_11451/g.20250 Transcript_11451/m.20250 type:complete len:235 (+) Transcript_11451:224-928(+)